MTPSTTGHVDDGSFAGIAIILGASPERARMGGDGRSCRFRHRTHPGPRYARIRSSSRVIFAPRRLSRRRHFRTAVRLVDVVNHALTLAATAQAKEPFRP